ncbi:Carbohydrate binding domain-containing protein [Lachnospiraceae bacterium XBD2001]|nr:Carbohydrate binding domain-containing protein [Lachnospiraceae bacterium XBD2001]
MKRGILKKSLVYTAMFSLVAGAIPQVASAAEPTDDGYQLVWSDEFDGSTLNTADWNVEQHEPGWVNSELQRYTGLDEGNIQVADGHLAIRPHVTDGGNANASSASVEKTEIVMDANVGADKPLSKTIALQVNFGKIGDGFEDTSVAATVKLYDISLKEVYADGTESDELLKNPGFDDNSNWTGGPCETGVGSISYADGAAVIRIENPGDANYNIQLLQEGITLEGGHNYKLRMTAESDVNRSVELSLLDPKNGWNWYGGGKYIIAGGAGVGSGSRSITSGRITTQGKHDFTYGRFEAKAKVPTGQGYLPAFWLMASDEGLYGQWPKCGEIDIMEVMGQNVNKSYHTIHYGYNSGNGHKENQGTKVLSTGDFANDYHVYRVDWEPGVITWYVDNQEVYSTRDWYTGQDDDNQITYPAPFDQNFYVILNLAVGGSWVGYPNDETYADMNNQEYDVDYVRVYQKSAEEYAREEAAATRPEAAPVSYREADADGNFVKNGDFATDIKMDGAADASPDNWKLHLESDAADTTYTVADNSIRLVPSAVGSQNHSVQLKQENIPMRKGWEYELTFDAVAKEARDIVVDVEGPDRGWMRYMQDTKVSVGTTKQSYSYSFTMNEKNDPKASLEFNLGKQGSTAPVTLSNVCLKHKSGDEVPEDNSKVIRPDGNYIYNGGFDMGDKRLGFWEYDASDASNISVTNAGNVRELKVVVPEGKTIRLTQSELSPMLSGEYELSFDGYTAAGTDADGLTVKTGGKMFTPSLSASRSHFSKKIVLSENLDRNASNVELLFSKPGTYYIDNVFLCESALIKNGSFNAGIAGFTPYIYDSVTANYVIDNMNGNDNAFAITIDDTMADDSGNSWYVQLNQDGVTLEQGKQYRLSFRAKSSIQRVISVAMQEFEGNWTNYSKTGSVEIGPQWKDFSFDFTMEDPTDTAARFNITMGSVDGVRITQRHDVFIDDISLVELEEEPSAPAPEPAPGVSPTPQPAPNPAPSTAPAPVVVPAPIAGIAVANAPATVVTPPAQVTEEAAVVAPARPRTSRTNDTKPATTASADAEDAEEAPETAVSENAPAVAKNEEAESPTENVAAGEKTEKHGGFFAAIANFFKSIFEAILGWFK